MPLSIQGPAPHIGQSDPAETSRQIIPLRVRKGCMAETKTRTDHWLGLFSRLERRGEPLAPGWRFARRLAINVGIALVVVLISLFVGMLGYHHFEELDWTASFGHAAMILGGMGPYNPPKHESSQLFEGLYALYSGLLLVGVTGLILAPVFHRVMHQLHLPDEEGPEEGKPKSAKSRAKAKP
jgi:hypothetical protein